MKQKIIYYRNDSISYKYYINDRGKRHGLCISYWSNGGICQKSNFVNGKLYGKLLKFYSDGNIMQVYHYVNDKEYGLKIDKFNSGDVWSQKYIL